MLKEKIFQTLYNVVLTNDHIKKIKMIVGIGERADDAHKQHLILKDQQSFIDSQLAELHSFDRNLVNKMLTNTLMALSVSDAGINDNQKRQIIKASILISKRLLILKGIIGIEPISNHSNVVHYMDVTTDNLLNDDGSIMYTFTPKSHPVTLADLSANAQYINDLAVTNNEVFESLYIDKIV